MGQRCGQLADRRPPREVREVPATALGVDLRALALRHVGVRNDGSALMMVQGHDGHREPTVGDRMAARVLEREARTRAIEHPLDTGERNLRERYRRAREMPAGRDVIRAHPEPRVPCRLLGRPPYPALVHGDDPAFVIQDCDAAGQGRQDG